MGSQLTKQDARTAAQTLALLRVGIGAVAITFPGMVLRPWVGADSKRPTVRLLSRALGGRDIALGLGALLALRHEGPVRGWLEAGGLADAGDVLTTVVGWRAAPRGGRWLVLMAAGAGVAGAGVLAGSVD
jgi:hypothetical protein